MLLGFFEVQGLGRWSDMQRRWLGALGDAKCKHHSFPGDKAIKHTCGTDSRCVFGTALAL